MSAIFKLSHHLALVLEESRLLRLATVILFYFNQGVAPGFFVFALPAWLAMNGQPTGSVAMLVSASALPWSLKFLNGFLVDRYTFLPMGRRRAWIIGAQILLLAVLLVGAAIAPQPSDIILLSALGFCANIAVNFQDVGIDALAIDLMPDDERARAAGLMLGAQFLGHALTTALAGWALEAGGFQLATLAIAVLPAATVVYGLVVRERTGERRLPWGQGGVHPRNRERQAVAWVPLLIDAWRALLVPGSLVLLPLLLLRAVPSGAFETFMPGHFSNALGWDLSAYTRLVATLAIVTGAYAVAVGGRLAEWLGERGLLAFSAIALTLLLAVFGTFPSLWELDFAIIGLLATTDLLIITYAIALVPVSMRLCLPNVAATQFVIYMGLSGVGRPVGALIAALMASAGFPQAIFWMASGSMALAALWALTVSPAASLTQHRSA
jgi:PAT family beta-lactamase induction signal transducer AmpG